MEINDGRALLSFYHAEKGLFYPDAELKGFTICGSDRSFVPAQARIVGQQVEVYSEHVDVPAAVRYGWRNFPDGNLTNFAGHPVSSFRTDNDPIGKSCN